MKTLNLSLLASCISLILLSGCDNGSDTVTKIDHITDNIAGISDDIKDSIDDKKTKKITVIDGYLENADVYIDRNGDQIADPAEKLAKKTNNKGQINISIADAKFDLIAQINGSATKDSDSKGHGTTGRSYQMIAKAGLNYITPFTTIAKVQNKTLATVAADLNISENVISGDYVAQKKNTETADDAKKAHAYARNLTTTLSENINKNKSETVTRVLNEIKTEIDSANNNDVDLNDLNISSTVKLQDIFVAGNTFHSIPLNSSIFNQEKVTTLNIIDDSSFTFNNEKQTDKGSFKFAEDNANVVTFTMENGKKVKDHPLSITKNSYISIDKNDGIMDVYSKTMTQQAISKATFANTQWYQLFDDSDYHKGYNKPQPCIMKVNFNTNGSMKYSEMGDCRVEGGDLHEYPYQWKVEKNQLVIFDNDTTNNNKGGEALRNILSSNEQMMVTVNVMKNADTKTALYIKDKKQAIALFNAWKKAIKH